MENRKIWGKFSLNVNYVYEFCRFNNLLRKTCTAVFLFNEAVIKACSYDPAYRDVSLTDDLAA
jgi:hypothetical protein